MDSNPRPADPTATRILVVEDEALVAAEIVSCLRSRGYEVLGPVDTAETAFAMAQEHLPSLVLMDIRLKGQGDGIAAAERISRTYDLPVVFLTANADDATYRRARSAAQYGYVLKPFHERDLLMAVDLALHRSAVERELRRTNLTHATISAAVPIGIVATDIACTIRFVNPAAEQLLGRTLLQLVGQDVASLSPVDEATGRAVEVPTPVPGAAPHHVAARIRSAADADIAVDLGISPILDADGRSVGTVWTLRDLRAERRQQARVREQEKLAAVGQLAGGIAHEFNNLLTVIAGSADLLADGDPSDIEGNRDIASAIVDASRRAAGLVEQLLHFSRQEPDGESDTDPNAAIVQLESLLRIVLGESMELQLRLDERAGRVRLSATALEGALVALARNAREATDGAGRLTITTRRVALDGRDAVADGLREASDTGHAVEVAVTDTGRGVDPALLPRIFEPFFTTKDPGQGPGLGLPTVFATVRRARGVVDAQSAPGRGTTVRMLLPECAPAFTERASAARSPVAPLADRTDGTIVVAEDDPTVRGVTARMIRNLGFAVVEATDAASALALLREPARDIALLVTDIALPRVNGLELMLQARVVRPGLPVLLVSGHGSDAQWRKLIDATAAPFLPKPFTRQELEAAIAATLAPA